MLLFETTLARAADTAVWQRTIWQGEPAYVSESHGWKAIVSVSRARLVHFGPAEKDLNLLFSTPTQHEPTGWGGHRLWLGPQKTWPQIWPPPEQWEHSAAAQVDTRGERLELALRHVAGGWADIVRTYAWDDAKLVCGAELHGGSRDAQIISIIQVPGAAEISVEAEVQPRYPAGYVRLPSGVSGFATKFEEPKQVSRHGSALTLRHAIEHEKLGFRPQTLSAKIGDYVLHVARGAEKGKAVAEPDEGFHTQVYIGRHDEPFIELEQLTSIWSSATSASAAVILSAESAP
jgi:hypothetical protein